MSDMDGRAQVKRVAQYLYDVPEQEWPQVLGLFPEAIATAASELVTSVRAEATPLNEDEFEIGKCLGAGNSGDVFIARQKAVGNREIALKLMRFGPRGYPADRRMFEQEVAAAARLHHEGIVTTYKAGVLGGKYYLAMQLIEGESLASRLVRRPLEQDECVALMKKLCEAVQYAHDQGVIHRDINPNNILLNEKDEPVVCDFGIARILQNDRVTATGGIKGTMGYMAPEQIDSEYGLIGRRTDVFGLGAVFYHLLAGKPPFVGDSEFLIGKDTLETYRNLPSHIEPRLRAICRKCLGKRPDDRYETVNEILDDLLAYERNNPLKAAEVGFLQGIWQGIWHEGEGLDDFIGWSTPMYCFAILMLLGDGASHFARNQGAPLWVQLTILIIVLAAIVFVIVRHKRRGDDYFISKGSTRKLLVITFSNFFSLIVLDLYMFSQHVLVQPKAEQGFCTAAWQEFVRRSPSFDVVTLCPYWAVVNGLCLFVMVAMYNRILMPAAIAFWLLPFLMLIYPDYSLLVYGATWFLAFVWMGRYLRNLKRNLELKVV